MTAPSFPLQSMNPAPPAGAALEVDSGSDSAIEMSRQGSSRAANHPRFDSAAENALPTATSSPSQSRRASSNTGTTSNPDLTRNANAAHGSAATHHAETASVSTYGWQFDEVNLESPPPYSAQDPATVEIAEPQVDEPRNDNPQRTAGARRGLSQRLRGRLLWGVGWSVAACTITLAFAPLWAPVLGTTLVVSPFILVGLAAVSLGALAAAALRDRQQRLRAT